MRPDIVLYLIEVLVIELTDRINAELEAAYKWGVLWQGLCPDLEIDPLKVVHQRANVIKDLIRATSQVLEAPASDGAA